MYKNLILIISLLIGSALSLTGCEPHRIDIQQGNRIKPETFDMLKLGMTRKQVLFVLGSPLLIDPFHQDRWDYLYYLKPGNEPVKQSRVTLFFEGDTLVKIDDSEYRPEMHDDMVPQEEINENDLPPSLNSLQE